MSETVAFVGAAGGVGTTRTTLGCAELLARDGRDTVVLDAAYGTQGLADRISGTIDPDMTRLCLEKTPLESGLLDQPIEGAGRLSVCPATAPFCRLAEAKTVEAAERFESRIGEATRAFEYVLVDTPPIAANQAVAAATTVDTVAVVCDAARAESAIPRTADRLADIGVERYTSVVTHTSEHPDADATVPSLEPEPPVVDSAAIGELADAVEAAVGVRIEPKEPDGLLSELPFK